MFAKIREYIGIFRDMSASCVDVALTVLCVWCISYLHTTGVASLAYAGKPPSGLTALMALKDDPFLLERLQSWSIVSGCIVLGIILAVSAIEGCWSVLRRI